MALLVPGRSTGDDVLALGGLVAVGEERDHREQSQQRRGGPPDRLLRPMPLRLKAQALADQTSPLSARHIAGVTLAEKSGVECARGPYLWDFTLFTSPISRHPKSAYASQGL